MVRRAVRLAGRRADGRRGCRPPVPGAWCRRDRVTARRAASGRGRAGRSAATLTSSSRALPGSGSMREPARGAEADDQGHRRGADVRAHLHEPPPAELVPRGGERGDGELQELELERAVTERRHAHDAVARGEVEAHVVELGRDRRRVALGEAEEGLAHQAAALVARAAGHTAGEPEQAGGGDRRRHDRGHAGRSAEAAA